MVLAASACALHPARAAHAAPGTPIADRELARADGQGKAHLFDDAKASVLVFFRPGQSRSTSALHELAKCQEALAPRPVRWVGIVTESAAPDALAAMLREAGFRATVLVDAGDALYGSLGLALHPVVVIAGQDRRLAAFEPFRSVDFCPVVSAHVRHALREITDEGLRAALEPPAAPASVGDPGATRHRALAEALLRTGNLDKALEYARKSVERDPASADSHALVGKIASAKGDCAAALDAFDRALAIDPAHATAKAGKARCPTAR